MGFLPETTDFIHNAIAIDPEGCGCTDCILRFAIHPSQDYLLTEAVQAYRTILNRSGGPVTLPVVGVTLADDDTWMGHVILEAVQQAANRAVQTHPDHGRTVKHCRTCTCTY